MRFKHQPLHFKWLSDTMSAVFQLPEPCRSALLTWLYSDEQKSLCSGTTATTLPLLLLWDSTTAQVERSCGGLFKLAVH